MQQHVENVTVVFAIPQRFYHSIGSPIPHTYRIFQRAARKLTCSHRAPDVGSCGVLFKRRVFFQHSLGTMLEQDGALVGRFCSTLLYLEKGWSIGLFIVLDTV